MVMEPKTTGIAVVGELMFPSDLLRFEGIRVGEIWRILEFMAMV